MVASARDLIVVVAAASLALALALLAPAGMVLRVVLVAPLALVLPGYALTAALFPRRSGDASQRLLLALALSLAIAALSGLLLNLLPAGLQTATWAVWLWAFTLAASVAALARRRRLGVEAPRSPTIAWERRQIVLLGVAVVLVVAAVEIARLPVPADPDQGYTALSLEPVADAPTGSMRLGILSQELATTDYRLEMFLGERPVKVWPDIALAPGDAWELQVDLADVITSDQPLTVRLYRSDSPGVYRYATYWPNQGVGD